MRYMDDALDSLHVASKAQTRQGQARLFPQNRRYTRSRERTASCPWHGFCSSTLWPAENGHAEFLTMQSRRSLFWETPVCARSPQLAERLQVSCELPFFRALRTRLGREVPNRVVPLQLVLPSLPAAAEEEHKELLSVTSFIMFIMLAVSVINSPITCWVALTKSRGLSAGPISVAVTLGRGC